ncbi:MAG: threonine synthase [Smithellaceae bacterium]|nr:threonine synthase [Smithellaceae bacterium]
MGRKINYFSTNRDLPGANGLSSRKGTVTFREALLQGQAPDEGLYMPDYIPRLSVEDLNSLRGKPYSAAANLVAQAFLADEIPAGALSGIISDAYNFDVPLERVTERKFILRLDQGPTASFKDFAARLMARLMAYYRPGGRLLNILVATSGDTGSAVGAAFQGVEGARVFILYPKDEVSQRQKRQLESIGGNVQAFCVAGKFDDCQNLVKQAFADPDLGALNFTSANSINFGRILPQIIYYVWAYGQLAQGGEEIVFSVPSGNFGNALGCEYARRMGLPVKKLVMPVNENDEFPGYLATGLYEKVDPSRDCLSNAMNVGHPSNLARFFHLYGGTVDRKGRVYRYPDLAEMRKNIYAVSISDRETLETIARVYRDYGLLLEPHGAVGWRGLELYLAAKGDFSLCVSLETAHPAKFPEAIEETLGFSPELPASMKDIDERTGDSIFLSNDYLEFKELLLRRIGQGD